MQILPQNRSTLWFLALNVLLITGLAAGVALFVLQMRGPVGETEFTVAPPQAVDCPTGSGVPVCYRFDVTNTGGGAGPMRCAVSPADESAAVFTASGSGVYESDGPVAAGDTYALYTEVEAAEGTTIADRPTVACMPSG